MQLIRLTYHSQVTPNFKGKQIQQVLDVSAKNNKAANISGFLTFNRKHIIQCLEGERHAVNQLYRTIINDERHTRCTIIDHVFITETMFDYWSMAYLPETDITRRLFTEITGKQSFDPDTLTPEQCEQLVVKCKVQLNTERGNAAKT